MDRDTLDLVTQLCSYAGRLMEDASAEAILLASIEPDELALRVIRLANDAERICKILQATRTLLGAEPSSRPESPNRL
jgi:hypothetical protein